MLAGPAEAARAARDVLALTPASEAGTRAVAWRAVALSAVHRASLDEATEAFDNALAAARASGDPPLLGRVALTGVAVLAERGELGEALSRADEAVALLTGADQAEALLYRSMVCQMLGRDAEALSGFGAAASAAASAGDVRTEVRALHNRGTLLTRRGSLDAATADLEASLALSRSAGLDAAAELTMRNLAEIATLQGDLPTALRRAEELRFAADPDPVGLVHLADCLLAARLPAEALPYARAAQARLAEAGRVDAAVAQLRVATAELDAGNLDAARVAASAAFEDLSRQGRTALADEADSVRIAALARAHPALGHRITVLADDVGRGDTAGLADLADDAAALAARLQEASLHRAELDARLIAAQCRLAIGDRAGVHAVLDEVATSSAASRERRVRMGHAAVLCAAADGDSAAALAAARRGLAELDAYRSELGAAELRASVSELGAELASWVIALSLAEPPAALLEAIESVRAPSLRAAPVRPPDDGSLRDLLGQLRALPADADDQERARLERAVVTRTRQVAGGIGAAVADAMSPLAVADLTKAIGGDLFVTLAPHDGRFVAVRVDAGEIERIDELPSDLFSGLAGIAQGLDRLARPGGPGRLRDAAQHAVEHALARIDAALFAGGVAPGARVVVSTPAELAGIPWSALPSLRTSRVVLTPSASLWVRASDRLEAADRRGRCVVAAGPDLVEAAAEAAAVAALHAGSTLLGDGAATVRATVDAVLAAAEGAWLVHIAAHGRFQADNPLLSSLRVADGPLTVYDLTDLAVLPAVVVLSACDAGLSVARAGNETLGLVASLLHQGAAAVVAACCRVPDELTRRFMIVFHEHLVTGEAPATAMMHARAAFAIDPTEALLTGAFACHGSG